MARANDVCVQKTGFTKHCVFLDNFTIMNALHSKKCFSERPITEIISHVTSVMNIKLNIGMSFKSVWHKFMYYYNILKEGKEDNTPIEIIFYIAVLEYQISVYGIYIERFMNKKWLLNKANIGTEKVILKHAI